MPAEVVPGAGSMPRRARHLIPTQIPRRGEVMAACAVLVLLAHLLFAQLTFVLAAVFAGVGRASRWRLWWLTVPAAAGLAWTLAMGPRPAIAGFAAGPAQILAYLSGGGHPPGHLLHPLGAFAGAGSWLPRQFPLALVAAAAEAALAGWLDWVHTDEWAVPPPRPGALAAARGAAARRVIRAGAVVTRDGCALGVAPASGARVVLGWPEVAGGVLVTGAAAQILAVSSLQVVHAALRRRKPLITVDLSGAAALGGALTAACAATGTPLQVFGTAMGCYEPFRHASPARRLAMTLALLGFDDPGGEQRGGESAGARPAPGIRDYLRAVFELIDTVPAAPGAPVLDDVLYLLSPPALRARLGLLPAGPRRDRLAELVRESERMAQADPEGLKATARRLKAVRESPAGRRLRAGRGVIDLARVVRERSAALFTLDTPGVAALVCADVLAVGQDLRGIGADGDGLVWLYGYEEPSAGPLAGLVASLVTGGAAAGLPVLVTTASPTAAADLAGLVNAVLVHRLADAAAAGTLAARTGTRLAAQAGGAELVPLPAVPPRTLLSLGPAQFVLTVSSPRYRLVELGQAVPARLPRGAVR